MYHDQFIILPLPLPPRDGRLKVGDELLVVNRKSLIGLTLKDALEAINMATNPLQLVIATEVRKCVCMCVCNTSTMHKCRLGWALNAVWCLCRVKWRDVWGASHKVVCWIAPPLHVTITPQCGTSPHCRNQRSLLEAPTTGILEPPSPSWNEREASHSLNWALPLLQPASNQQLIHSRALQL